MQPCEGWLSFGDGLAARGEIEITATTFLVTACDSKGRPVTDLEASDLLVTEDGDPANVLSLERLVPDLHVPVARNTTEPLGAVTSQTDQTSLNVPVTVYVDRRLGGDAAVSATLKKLEDLATGLWGAASVQVSDDPST